MCSREGPHQLVDIWIALGADGVGFYFAAEDCVAQAPGKRTSALPPGGFSHDPVLCFHFSACAWDVLHLCFSFQFLLRST